MCRSESSTCSVTDHSTRSRQATHEILGVLYKDFVGGVGPTVLPMHVAEALRKQFQIKIEYWKAYRTLRHARILVRGTPESGYELLPAYLYMIKRANLGTYTRLEVDDAQRFKYLFIAFSASINGFLYMRKVMVVDGIFAREIQRDTSYCHNSRCCVIPDDESLVIISDRHQSIVKAISTVYPKASRGICTYHLYMNILVRFRGREAFALVRKASNAYRLVDFQATFDQIQQLHPKLHSYLQRADVRLWTHVHFPGDRYNLLTSNIAESMNNVLSKARSLPIVQLLEVVRAMMTRWFSERRTDAMKLPTSLTRGVEKLLESRVEYARMLTVQDIEADQVQVTKGSSVHVVNLRHLKCSCRRFDLEKLPCAHAIAVAESRNISRISISHAYFHKLYLFNSYSTAIMPRDFALPIPESVATEVCALPIPKQQPCRPKKSRFKSVLEKMA
ncbi:PREDICTED: uncharacterized protein LOC104728162 [Camelina sativa]|uniref:Uncharacterized protein LOC104728162 n=1 Tax=Camelina sativa TaxID=90675 RepID=A0ABM0USE4_CAMSA|nr:PREDICTED: uncharacterized protein LOC104728162 [Camelina sativa]